MNNYITFFAILVISFIAVKNSYVDNRIITKQKQKIQQLTYENNKMDSLIIDYKYKENLTKAAVKEMFSDNFYTTRLTGYHPVPEQCDNTPDITADGTKIDITKAGDYRYVALSRDLLAHFNKRGADINYGDYILIKGTPNGEQDGIYQVRDTMNARHTEWIDILLTPGQQAFYYKKVLMYKINPEYLSVLQSVYDIPDDFFVLN